MESFIYNTKKMGNPAYQAFFYCKERKGEWENTNRKDSIFCVDSVLPKSERQEMAQNFAILQGEKKLYLRDSSLFNKRDQGVVITDTAIHYIKYDIEDLTIVFWTDIRGVKEDAENFIIVTHDDKIINISKDDVIKGYDYLDEQKQKKSSSKVLFMFQTMADAMPYVKPLNYKSILHDALYQPAKNSEVCSDLMIRGAIEYDVSKLQSLPDLQPYLHTIQKFELFKQQISARIGDVSANIKRAAEQIQDSCRYMVMNNIRQSNQGIRSLGNRENILAAALYAATEIYSTMRENELERKKEIFLRNCEQMQNKWYNDNFNHLAEKLYLYNRQIGNMSMIVNNMLLWKISKEDMNPIQHDTSLGCFALHCRLVYAQQWTASMLQFLINVSKQLNQDAHFMSMEEIIQKEYGKLLDRTDITASELIPICRLLNQNPK